jgi:hypothetical protein
MDRKQQRSSRRKDEAAGADVRTSEPGSEVGKTEHTGPPSETDFGFSHQESQGVKRTVSRPSAGRYGLLGIEGADDGNVAHATRTLRTGHQEKRKQNERELYKKWGAAVAPPMPSDEPSSDKQLWVDDDPVHIGEILIRAGKTVAFKLDQANQSFELDADVEKFAAPKVRTLAHAAKYLIAGIVPGSAATVSVRSLYRLDLETSKATPTIRLRFQYVASAMRTVAALESSLRNFMGLVGSVTDALFLSPANELLPDDPAAPQVVALARQIRTSVPRAAVAPGVEMTSALFKAPVPVPERIGTPPPQEGGAEDDREEEGEVVGYLRPERTAFVLFPGRRSSTALVADMEVFFPILRQEAQVIGNTCRIRYRPDQDQPDKEKGKLLRVEVLWQGHRSERPELTVAEVPELADAQSSEPAP